MKKIQITPEQNQEQSMTRAQAIDLLNALASKDLKVKFLSATAYVDLIELRRPLNAYLTSMGEDENTLLKEMGLESFDPKNKEFMSKVKKIQSKTFTPKKLNFIPVIEFKKFTDDADFNIGGILGESLMERE